jgi:hypothetical protein
MIISQIEIEKYYPAQNADYRGNPAIEFFPPLSKAQIAMALSSPVDYDEEERTHSVDLRLQYIHRLLRFFVPFQQQTDFAFNLWTTILQSYVRRNPLARATQTAFIEMAESFAMDSYVAKDEKSLFDSPNCITLIGTPGCAKTAIPKRLLSKLSMDAVFYHRHRGGSYQKLFVWVEAPNAKHQKSMAWSVYEALYQALQATGATRPMLKTSESATVIGKEAAIIARKLNIGVIVVDEIQHAVHGSDGMDQDSMEFLTTLINRVECPVLLIGTWKACALMRSELRLGRRAISPASTFFRRLEQGDTWDAFVDALLQLQYTINRVEPTPEIRKFIYHYTQGVPDITVKLIALVQLEAITSGEEMISETLIRECAEKHLHLIAPAIHSMRDGAKEDAPTTWDAEPQDFAKYFACLEAECQARMSAKERRRRDAQIDRAVTTAAVAGALVSLNMAGGEAAQAIAEQRVADAPGLPAEDHVARAIKDSKLTGPRPTKSLKQQAKVDNQFAELADGDVRKVVYLASRTGKPAIQALRDSGHVARLTELVPL